MGIPLLPRPNGWRLGRQPFNGPVDEGWAKMIQLRDPDGNYVELVERIGS
jgi:hypothetical protein